MVEGNGSRKPNREPDEVPEDPVSSLWLQERHPFDSLVHSYSNIFSVPVMPCSEGVLPTCSLPLPAISSSIVSKVEDSLVGLYKGESSGAERVHQVSQIQSGIVEPERVWIQTREDVTHETRSSVRRRGTEGQNMTERRRRHQMNEKLRTLKSLIPNCNKSDKASILGDAVDYIRSLQHQLLIMQSMGLGVPQFPPYDPARYMLGASYGGTGFYGWSTDPAMAQYYHTFPALLDDRYPLTQPLMRPQLPSTLPVSSSGVLFPADPQQQQSPFHYPQPYPAWQTSRPGTGDFPATGSQLPMTRPSTGAPLYRKPHGTHVNRLIHGSQLF